MQIGLRGYWPGEAEFAWQREAGITSFFMHDVRDLGIRDVVERTVAAVGDGPVFLTVDVDVLDPSVRAGDGDAGAGRDDLGRPPLGVPRDRTRGSSSWARRRRGPPHRHRFADVTALVADRIVREALTGIALRRGNPHKTLTAP